MNFWFWVLIAATVPMGLCLLVTLFYSIRGDPMIGAVLGSGVVFASCMGFIAHEYVELARFNLRLGTRRHRAQITHVT